MRVNAVAPLARTRVTDALTAYRTPTGVPSVADPEALAPLFVFLMSDAAGAVNGQMLRFNGRALSVMRHPGVAPSAQTREAWDLPTLQAPFESPLAAELQPLGLAAQGGWVIR